MPGILGLSWTSFGFNSDGKSKIPGLILKRFRVLLVSSLFWTAVSDDVLVCELLLGAAASVNSPPYIGGLPSPRSPAGGSPLPRHPHFILGGPSPH